MSWFNSFLAGGTSNRVDGSAARQLVSEGALLVDVRTPMEFHSGHIQGAVNLPLDQLHHRAAELPKDKPLIVYCLSGARSARASGVLSTAGLGPVHDLGPISAW